MRNARIKLFLRFFKHLRPYGKAWFVVLLLGQGTVLVGLFNPFLAKFAIDEAVLKRDLKLFFMALGVGVIVFLFNAGIGMLKEVLERYIRTRVHFDMSRLLFTRMQKLSISWFKDKATGEHLYKFDKDLDIVTDFISGALPQAIMLFSRFLLIWVILCWLNWHIALFSLCLVPLYCLPPYYLSRRMERIFQEITDFSESMLRNLEEYFSHIYLIKVFGKERESRRSYFVQLIRMIRLNVKNLKFELLFNLMMELAGKIVVGLMTFYGGYLVIRGDLTLGALAAIMAYFYQLVELQSQAGSFFQSSSLGFVSCQRIAGVLDELPEVIDAAGARGVIFDKGEVVFKDISFGYRPDRFILKGVNFTIAPGSHIALVGPSGCGKTTLLNLIVRLYDPQVGGISIDGHDISLVNGTALKKQIGFALQESFLWNDTIANNILYGNDKAARVEVEWAAEVAGVSEFAGQMPKGYDTVIGELASKISEGQKQKIAIARAIIKKPVILILDEAMASMDSVSEEKILSNIKKHCRDTTLITVSHRLSTVMAADSVYYLASPDTITIGKARGLFENNKSFATLFAGQEKIFA